MRTGKSERRAVVAARGGTVAERQLYIAAVLFAAVLFAAVLFTVRPASAGSVTMKSGLRLEGIPSERLALTSKLAKERKGPVPVYTVWAIEDGMRTYYVPRRQIEADSVDTANAATRFEVFRLPQQRMKRTLMPESLGGVDQARRFDEFGRRVIPLASRRGVMNAIQGVTELRPDRLWVESLNLEWNYGLDTSTRSDDELLGMLRQATDADSPSDQLAIVRFLIQAERYDTARKELEAAAARLPELESQAKKFRTNLNRLYGLKAVDELNRRKAAGQHRLVRRLAGAFDIDRVSPETYAKAEDLLLEYEDLLAERDRVEMELGLQEAELTPEEAALLRPLRSAVMSELIVETLPRLEPFVRSLDDPTQTAANRLALAYSGWLGGNASLTSSLPEAVRLWRLREGVLECLRAADDYDFREAANELVRLEGATVEAAAAIIPNLPPVLETVIPAGGRLELEAAASRRSEPTEYVVQLPAEFHPLRHYPMIVALPPAGGVEEVELRWWSGTPGRPGLGINRGYVVVVPKLGELSLADESGALRDAVLDVIRDAKRRFGIDSDRVIMAGHGRGGTAALDLGMSRSFEWAGVVSVGGLIREQVRGYWEQALSTPLLLVGGQLDGTLLEENSRPLDQLMKRGRDVVYCEYVGRGPEMFAAERERVFEWMRGRSRPPMVREWEVAVTRPIDAEWDWLRLPSVQLPRAGRSQMLAAKLTVGNSLYLRTGRQAATVWLSPETVNFDKRLTVRVNSRGAKRNVVTPSLTDLLEDLRTRADRQRLYWAKLDF